MSNETGTKRHYFTDKPISYDPWLDNSYDGWAEECGWDPQSLRQATEEGIRTRHHEAVIEHETHKAHGNQPDIFTLSLGSVDVIYTVEPSEVVIRGYGWEIDHEPYDFFDGGGFYRENSWSIDPAERRPNTAVQSQAKTLAVSQEFVGAVREVVDYLWDDERRHCQEHEMDGPAGHIFGSLRLIKQWLDEHFPEVSKKS